MLKKNVESWSLFEKATQPPLTGWAGQPLIYQSLPSIFRSITVSNGHGRLRPNPALPPSQLLYVSHLRHTVREKPLFSQQVMKKKTGN